MPSQERKNSYDTNIQRFCAAEDTQTSFVVTLTNNIMSKPGAISGDKRLNPMMNKSDRSLQHYYNGDHNRGIPVKDAHVIIAHMKKIRFEEYINGFSDDVLRNISNEFTKNGVSSVTPLNVAEKCADIFEAILIYGKYEEA